MTYRWYNQYALPEDLGGSTVTVPLHGNDEDAKRKLNRTENLRPIAPSDPVFADLFTRRNDAESITVALTTRSSSGGPIPSAPAARPSTCSATP